MTVYVSIVTNMVAGKPMMVDYGGTPETVTISALGTAPVGGDDAAGGGERRRHERQGRERHRHDRRPSGPGRHRREHRARDDRGGRHRRRDRDDAARRRERRRHQHQGRERHGHDRRVTRSASTPARASSSGRSRRSAPPRRRRRRSLRLRAAGATNVKVTSVTGMTAGHQIRVDTGANLEIGTIVTVGTAGWRHRDHADSRVDARARERRRGQDLGTGVTLAAPLALAHAAGAASGSRHGHHARGSAAARARSRRGGPGRRHRGHFHPGARERARLRRRRQPARRHPGVRLVERGAARDQRQSLSGCGQRDHADEHDLVPDRPVARLELGSRADVRGREGGVGRGARDRAQNKLDLDFYSPTVNLVRDPRWGRNDESYGEDPLLEAKVASQFVNGMEGKDRTVSSCRTATASTRRRRRSSTTR